VTSAADVLEDLGLANARGDTDEPRQPTLLVGRVPELSPNAAHVLAVMQRNGAVDVAALSRGSGLAVPEILATVAELALSGLADSDGASYRLTAAGRSTIQHP